MGISLNPATILSGQGIDVSSLVQEIINKQSGVLTEWQSEASTLATQAGLLEGFNNNLTSLASAVSVLADPAGPLSDLTTDSSQAVTAVNNFVTAYNTLISDINQQYVVDPATDNEGPLGSDISVRSLQSSLLTDAAYAVTGNDGYVNLATLGISTNDDGTLSVDTTTLNNVLSKDPTAFQNFFQNSSGTGFANNFNTDLNNLTDPVTGVLNADLAQNSAQTQSLNSDISNFQTNLAAEQQQLTQQYDAVNASLDSYPLLLQAVTEVLGSLGTTVSSTTGATVPGSPILTGGL